MASLLSAIRLAVGSGMQTHALDLIEGEPDAGASITEPPQAEANSPGGNMSGNQTLISAASASLATAASAAAPGGQDGAQAATDRLMTIMNAAGVKGDAGRMGAAIDLAASAPGMSADHVVAFVTANVPATVASGTVTLGAVSSKPASYQAASYEEQRIAAAALAQPNGSATALVGASEGSWKKAVAKANAKTAALKGAR